MSEQFQVIQHIVAAAERGIDIGLAVTVEHHGSTPRKPGAMLVLDGEGRQVGTIGGGELERQVTQTLARAMMEHRAVFRHFDLAPEGFGMPCGGRIRILMTPVSSPEDRTVFRKILEHLKRGSSCLLRAEMTEPGTIHWSIEAARQETLSGFDLHLEPPAPLFIFGAGHIAQALAPMAARVDFFVTVLDDREEQLERWSDAGDVTTVRIDSFENCLTGRTLAETDYVLIATYGHQHDLVVLRQVLATAAGYIGMVGSRGKRDTIFGRLKAEGMHEAALHRVRCPVGIPIRAETPAEIAVSILAEMIAHRRNAP
ncbi:MAG: XdhC/CoxI family protein [Thermodesulfobacteriota bacterium]